MVSVSSQISVTVCGLKDLDMVSSRGGGGIPLCHNVWARLTGLSSLLQNGNR
jgi:hypothetical protein